MADASPAGASNAPPGPGQRGGRGRGGQPRPPRGDEVNGEGGKKGGRGRGRGRGGRAARPNTMASEAGAPSPPNRQANGVFGNRLTEDAQFPKGEARGKMPAMAIEDDDTEVCFICASSVQHQAVAPCNHRTCHICALRLRALYKTKACAHCRSQAEYVIFTDEPDKRFEEFQESDFDNVDAGLGIKYEKADIFEDTLILLRYNCPDGACEVACLGWPDLHRHVRTAHGKWMCDLCTRNKKVFTHEHELFTKEELKKHEKFGDDTPGAIDQTGFKGHPECGFCRQRFYGDDELYTHCRDRHEKCHVCDRRDEGRRPQYYVDYNSLELHFRKDHFLCPDRECLEKKFVVFATEIDLKAHQIAEHPNGLTKDALRDARRVDLGIFEDLRERYQPSRNGRRGGRGEGRADERDGRGRGRGRDPNTEPLPASSAQPLRRDELAYRRQMAVQGASSINSRSFGGQLSTPSPAEAYAARAPEHPPTAMSGPVRIADPAPPLGSLHAGTDTARSITPHVGPEAQLTPQEQARRMRHQAVIERASNMLGHDQVKLAEFRTKISNLKNGRMTAAELIDDFFLLFDRPASELGSLVKELAEIFEISSKRDELLAAWNDWRAIHEDYPSLPGGGAPASISGSTTGKRVLKLKTSTQQSAMSAASRTASWGGASSNNNLFPTIIPARTGRAREKAAPKTAWATLATPSLPSASPSTAQPVRPPQPVRSVLAASGADAFPALPASARPKNSLFTPGYNGRAVLRQQAHAEASAANPWVAAGEGASAAAAAAADDDADGGDVDGGRRRGNKNKKQTLIHWG